MATKKTDIKPFPKIDIPVYQVKLPSGDKTISYRYWTIKERKMLLMALVGKDSKEINNAAKQVVGNCVFDEDIIIDNMFIYDFEYLFLQIRSKSEGATFGTALTDETTNTTKDITVNIDEILVKFSDEHDKKVSVNDDLMLILRDPTVHDMELIYAAVQASPGTDFALEASIQCVSQIMYKKELYNAADYSKQQIGEMLDKLNAEQFSQVEKFFATMPMVRCEIKLKQYFPNRNDDEVYILEGLNNFFG